MDALILFSHGSLLCGAGEALDSHAGRLRRTGRWPMVEVGYLNYSDPTFADAVAKCERQGATRVVVLPFFLVPGFFVTKSLPEQIAQAKADHPRLEFVIADALGFDERLADALIQAAQSPLGPGEWRDDLTAASRGCRARSDCPLYGTPDCPRAPEPNAPGVRLWSKSGIGTGMEYVDENCIAGDGTWVAAAGGKRRYVSRCRDGEEAGRV